MQELLDSAATLLQEWLTRERLETILVQLALSAAVLAVTYVLVKILSPAVDRLFGKKDATPENGDGVAPDQGALADSFTRSARVLLKTLLLYGSYFVAAVIILEIFHIKTVSPEDLKSLGLKIVKVAGVLVGARLVINIGHLAVKQVFARRDHIGTFLENQRAQTLEVLLSNILTYVIFFMAGLMILEIFNVNTGAILASAGIVGLAVGFGAQNLVKDVISGFFILFENQFNVGDFVETAGVVGTVEEIGLRTCKIRQWTGQLHVIPNGEITRVTNYNRGQMMAVVTLGIAYEEDIDQAIEVLRRECETAAREIEPILDTPQVQGVVELADSAVLIRAVAPTVPGEQWAVERELRRRFKYALDRAGIEIPYPRRVLYQREEDEIKSQERDYAI